MLAPPFPRRGHSINRSVLAAPASRQRAHNHALLVKYVQMPPLHRLNVVVAAHRLPALGALLRPQCFGLLDANHKRVALHFIVGADHFPAQPQSQQFLKRLFRCHFLADQLSRSPTYIPLKSSRNQLSSSPLYSSSIVSEISSSLPL